MDFPRDPSCLPVVSAYDPIENNLDKSDDILCNNMRYFAFKAKMMDDRIFCHQMQNCYLPSEKVIDYETKLWQGRKETDCSIGYHITRGGNAKAPSCNKKKAIDEIAVGYDNYNPTSLKEYLMVPCQQNTFRNHVACDAKKCCSVRHQLFMNMTRRV